MPIIQHQKIQHNRVTKQLNVAWIRRLPAQLPDPCLLKLQQKIGQGARPHQKQYAWKYA